MWKRKRIYFVSGRLETAGGSYAYMNFEVERKNKIKSLKDLNEIRDIVLNNNKEFNGLIILFFREF